MKFNPSSHLYYIDTIIYIIKIVFHYFTKFHFKLNTPVAQKLYLYYETIVQQLRGFYVCVLDLATKMCMDPIQVVLSHKNNMYILFSCLMTALTK